VVLARAPQPPLPLSWLCESLCVLVRLWLVRFLSCHFVFSNESLDVNLTGVALTSTMLRLCCLRLNTKQTLDLADVGVYLSDFKVSTTNQHCVSCKLIHPLAKVEQTAYVKGASVSIKFVALGIDPSAASVALLPADRVWWLSTKVSCESTVPPVANSNSTGPITIISGQQYAYTTDLSTLDLRISYRLCAGRGGGGYAIILDHSAVTVMVVSPLVVLSTGSAIVVTNQARQQIQMDGSRNGG
jgi:hypothetical protein